MRKVLFLITAIISIAMFIGCSDSDKEEQETKIEVAQNEIQGTWHTSSYGSYKHITFNGDNYSYGIMDVNNEEITHTEHGSYTINGINVLFTSDGGETKLGSCEMYWEDESKNYLHIYPVGSFTKAD